MSWAAVRRSLEGFAASQAAGVIRLVPELASDTPAPDEELAVLTVADVPADLFLNAGACRLRRGLLTVDVFVPRGSDPWRAADVASTLETAFDLEATPEAVRFGSAEASLPLAPPAATHYRARVQVPWHAADTP